MLLVLISFAGVTFGSELVLIDGSLHFRGAIPGASVLLFGVAHEPLGYETRIMPTARIITTSAAEMVFTPAPAHLLRSVWIAVDLTSAAVAAATAPGFVAIIRERSPQEIGSIMARVPRFSYAAGAAYLCLVRPREGAWLLFVADGGTRDEDRNPNGLLTLSTGTMRPVGTSGAAPAAPAPGDVLIAIDPQTLSATTTRVVTQ